MVNPPILVLIAWVLVTLSWWRVRRLPEPDDADEVGKLAYRDISPRWWWLSALVAAVLAWWCPDDFTMTWLFWASIGAVLACVDLVTTYLPSALQWPLTGALLVSIVLEVCGRERIHLDQALAVMAPVVGGSLLAGALFWLVWRFTASFGFGDVRLAFAVGALAGTRGWNFVFTSLLAGTALGAVLGLVMMLVRRWRPHPMGSAFAYGPALWAGPWLALLVS